MAHEKLSFLDAMPGDKAEFRSDRQTDKGPATGIVVAVVHGSVVVDFSDTREVFDGAAILVERLGWHHRGGPLWFLV